jgi:ferrous iron transport protein A
MHDLIPLSRLSSGRSAQIVEVVGGAEQVRRIHELGLRDGAQIQMVRSGSPCIIRLAGQNLCFRANELLSVLVRPGAAV